MRIYVFEHDGTYLFVLAGTELQARAVLRTHWTARESDEAVLTDSGMSFTVSSRGAWNAYVAVEPL